MGQSSPAPSMERPLKSRWLSRKATAFHVMVLPPTPRERSDSNPATPGRMVGMWRSGNSYGMPWVLKAVCVSIFGPPSSTMTSTPRCARWAESVPPGRARAHYADIVDSLSHVGPLSHSAAPVARPWSRRAGNSGRARKFCHNPPRLLERVLGGSQWDSSRNAFTSAIWASV